MTRKLRKLSWLFVAGAALGLPGAALQLTELIQSLWALMILPGIALAGLLALRRHWLHASALLVTCTALLAFVAPHFREGPPVADEASTKVIFANILYRQEVLDRTAAWAWDEGADLLLIAEMPRAAAPILPPNWVPMERRCQPSYIFAFVREGTISCEAIGDAVRPALLVRASDLPAELSVVGLHTTVPFKRRGLEHRRGELTGTTDDAPDGPVLLIGDLNTVPWSDDFERLTGKDFIRLPIGLRSTWLNGSPAVGLPIDHALIRGDIIASAEAGPWFGSDHRPIIVRIALPD